MSRSDIRAEPFCHGGRVAPFHVRYECYPFLSSRTDVRAIAILGMEAPGQLPGSLSVGLSSHSDVIEGCVPT